MDYLDPRKRSRHTILLYVGYVTIGIAILIGTTVLVYQASGYGVDKKGTVIQNGLLFISSQPQAADIYINGQLEKSRTNTRLVLPAANYDVLLKRTGYQDWRRTITLSGGEVSHYDYPLLIPKKLVSTSIAAYPSTPDIMTQSPDKRWLMLSQPTQFGNFDVYDLRNPSRPPLKIAIPANLLSPADGLQSWEPVEWADDNQHVLLKHRFNNTFEYVLVNRTDPASSVNLTTTLQANPSRLNLLDRKFDRYYLFDEAAKTLSSASLRAPAVVLVQPDVLAYRSYSDDTLLYATTTGASLGKARIRLQTADQNYTIRSVTANSAYLLDITKYENRFYVVVGSASENRVYVYRDPALQIGTNLFKSPTPIQVLRLTQPSFVSFSSNTQYVAAQNANQFAVYDIENSESYTYVTKQPFDAPQTNANWMDGNRLTYVSGGKQVIFDYDYKNVATLGAARSDQKPAFAADFRFAYSLTTDSTGASTLSQTALLIPSEL